MGFSHVDRNRLADKKKKNLVPRFSLLLVSNSLGSVGTGRSELWERGWKKKSQCWIITVAPTLLTTTNRDIRLYKS